MKSSCPFINRCEKGKYLAKLSKEPACLTGYHTSCQDFQRLFEEEQKKLSETFWGKITYALKSLFS